MKKTDAVYEVVATESYRMVYRVEAGSKEEAEEIVTEGWWMDTVKPDVIESDGELDIQEVDVYTDYEDYLMEREEY